MAISPDWPSSVTSLPLSSISFMSVLGTGTPIVPVYSLEVTGLHEAIGLVSDRP